MAPEHDACIRKMAPAQLPLTDQDSRLKRLYGNGGGLRAKLLKQGGRRYFDSGEFAMAVREGRAPDDLLPLDPDTLPCLPPKWKFPTADPARPRIYQPSRLSACSSA